MTKSDRFPSQVFD
ncbi:hypothetical protein D046_2475A, partial [Vibrio parahaemolyticus V-223/04]